MTALRAPRWIGHALVATVVLVVAGCGGDPAEVEMTSTALDPQAELDAAVSDFSPGVPGGEISSDDLAEAERLWDEARPRSYEYVVTIVCGGCPIEGDLTTRVVGDTVAAERFEGADGTETVAGKTIDELFVDLGELFGSDGGLVNLGVLVDGTAEYDPTYGYPRWIGIDLEIIEPQDSTRDLPTRLVYLIDRFTPIDADRYCTEIDELLSLDLGVRPDARYLDRLRNLAAADDAPKDHAMLWDLLITLAAEPFDYANFNPAADALDDTAESITQRCPNVGFFVMDDDGYVTYSR